MKLPNDNVLLAVIALLLTILAGVGFWLIIDSTITGKIVRWPI